MPRISIGLPVRNGERYLAEALEGLCAQTFTDFELILSDNASTDRTEEICREFCERDPRLRYLRQPQNVGAARNFNFVFEQARAEYFKWAAHDDLLAPRYLERCLAVLEAEPELVLCHARTGLVNPRGRLMVEQHYPLRLDSPRAWERFRDLAVIRHNCITIFGVIRRSVLARTQLIGRYVGSDRVLLCELALHGRMYEVPELLFWRRSHGACSSWLDERVERLAWFAPERAGDLTFPNWRILAETVAALERAPLPVEDRIACALVLLDHLRVRAPFLGADLVEALKLLIRRTEQGQRLYQRIQRRRLQDKESTETKRA